MARMLFLFFAGVFVVTLCGCQLTGAMYVEHNLPVDNNALHDIKTRAEVKLIK